MLSPFFLPYRDWHRFPQENVKPKTKLHRHLRRQTDAIVTGGNVGRASGVEIVGGGLAAARDDDEWTKIDEVGRVRAVYVPRIHLHDVGPPARRGPRDQNVAALRCHSDDVE